MVDDLESVDDMAGRLADQCRELINEGVTQYFGRLLAASGQRETRVVNIPKVTKESRKTRAKVLTKVERVIEALTDGPKSAAELGDVIGSKTPTAVHQAVWAAKKLIKGTTKVIRSQGGSKGRMRIYSMQDVDDLEGLPADD